MTNGRTAIVHIGHKKTGTSFIQHQLHRNRAALLEQGVLYPMREANHSFALSGLFRTRMAARAPSPLDGYAAQGDAGILALDDELNASDWTQLVLSAEALCGFSPPDLKVLKAWLERHVEHIRIVFVIRDPIAWSVSVAQQFLKTRGDVEDVLLKPNPVQWRNIINRFRRLFGDEAVTVLAYEALAADRVRFAGNFASAVGLSKAVAEIACTPGETVNESMSMEAALMLGRFNARVPVREGEARNQARSGLEHHVFAGLPGAKFDIPASAKLAAYEGSREDVAFVAREFGIKRYSYAVSEIPSSGYTEAVSAAFLDGLADRLVAFDAVNAVNRALIQAQKLEAKGDAKAAVVVLRQMAHRFPDDARVKRALMRAMRGVEG